MDAILAFVNSIEPQHWLVLGLLLLGAELASGTTYLLWPAVAALITALIDWSGLTNGIVDVTLFAALVIGLTAFGRPLVQRLRNEQAAAGLNQRGAALIGKRGTVTVFADGAGSVQIADTVWRATSDDALAVGDTAEIVGVDGATLKVKRAA